MLLSVQLLILTRVISSEDLFEIGTIVITTPHNMLQHHCIKVSYQFSFNLICIGNML